MQWLVRAVKAVAARVVMRARRGRHRPNGPPTAAHTAPSGPPTAAPYFDSVYALRSVERTFAIESERMPGLETGGVLVGFVDSRRNAVVVTAASGPGPYAQHGPFSFNRDRAFCQAFLDQYAAATGGVIDFVGEWHKHPEPDPHPSSVDVDTYRRLARDPAAHVDRPLVVITGTVPSGVPRGVAARAAWPFPASVVPRRPVGPTPPPGRSDRYVGANAFSFRSDGYVARTIRWLPDDAYDDLLRDPGTVLDPATEAPARLQRLDDQDEPRV